RRIGGSAGLRRGARRRVVSTFLFLLLAASVVVVVTLLLFLLLTAVVVVGFLGLVVAVLVAVARDTTKTQRQPHRQHACSFHRALSLSTTTRGADWSTPRLNPVRSLVEVDAFAIVRRRGVGLFARRG